MKGTSTICIRTDLKVKLDDLKLYRKDSYSDVIERLAASAFDTEPLSEKELEGLQEALEDLKAAHEQLIQAEKMASLGQLTAGIAHEINNPINFVSANIQPLKDDLNDVMNGVNEAFKNFEAEGISQQDLNRIKAGQETAFYTNLSSVLGKGFQLAQDEIFAGTPDYINQDVKNC